MSAFELARSFALEGRRVGVGQPVFVIAEIGVNHNGDLDLARALVDAAAACGADCVKLQTFRAEEFMADRSLVYEYESAGQKVRENMFDMFKRLEPPSTWYPEILSRTRGHGMVPLTSVADPSSLDLVDGLGISGFKLSSEDLVNLPLVEYAAAKGKPLLLSTGMADAEEVSDALAVLARHGNTQAAFLHCVSVYPTPDAEVCLGRIHALRALTGPNVGYSDHATGIEAALGAVALGATIVEKHFTLDRNLPGPDQSFSSDPAEFTQLVRAVRRMEAIRGGDRIEPSRSELELRKTFRRSIVAAYDLPAGHVLVREDLVVKRPGHGLKAAHMPALIGRRLKVAVATDEAILPDALEGDRLNPLSKR